MVDESRRGANVTIMVNTLHSLKCSCGLLVDSQTPCRLLRVNWHKIPGVDSLFITPCSLLIGCKNAKNARSHPARSEPGVLVEFIHSICLSD